MQGKGHLTTIVVAIVSAAVLGGGPAIAAAIRSGGPARPVGGSSALQVTQQRGWLVQYSLPGEVQTYQNLQLLEGGSLYYMNLVTPNVVGGQGYYLATVTICYDAEAQGDGIHVTQVLRSSNGNGVDIDFIDETDHHVVYPRTECYDESVQDTNAPSVSSYTVQLITSGGIRIIRVTASYSPRGTQGGPRNVSVRPGGGGSAINPAGG